MSVSGSRAAFDIDLEDFEKRLRTAGAPSGVEDPLSELARLVEASRPKGAGVAAAPKVVAAPAPTPPPPAPPRPTPPLKPDALRTSFTGAPDYEPEFTATDEAGFAEAADREERAFEAESAPPALPPHGPPRRWLLTASTLAVAGVAMIGAVFALKSGGLQSLPGVHKEPPFIAAAQGPTKVQPPSDETVATASESGANLLKDNTQPSKVKVVDNQEQPVDLSVETSPPLPAKPAPSAAGIGSGGPAGRSIDAPVVVAPHEPAPAASPFPEPKPVRTISLRPDGTPIPATVADAEASQAPPAQPAPEAAKAQPKAVAKAPADAANAQASTPKINLPTKLSPPKSSARVVVAKTDTTAPAEAPGEPVQIGSVGRSPRAAAEPANTKTQEAAAEPASPATEPAATSPAAAGTGGWAIQLAAPKSEAEAKSTVAKLNEKYASALGGSTLGVHKATVNGETVYRVRAVGLSKTDAASLCARIKGDGGQCFIAK